MSTIRENATINSCETSFVLESPFDKGNTMLALDRLRIHSEKEVKLSITNKWHNPGNIWGPFSNSLLLNNDGTIYKGSNPYSSPILIRYCSKRKYMNVTLNPTKIMYGDNILRHKFVSYNEFITKFRSILKPYVANIESIDFDLFRVLYLEYGVNLLLKHVPKAYLKMFNELEDYFSSEIKGPIVNKNGSANGYSCKSFDLVCYDKGAKGKRKFISQEIDDFIKNHNILRYELKFKRAKIKAKGTFNNSLYFGDLFEYKFLNKMNYLLVTYFNRYIYSQLDGTTDVNDLDTIAKYYKKKTSELTYNDILKYRGKQSILNDMNTQTFIDQTEKAGLKVSSRTISRLRNDMKSMPKSISENLIDELYTEIVNIAPYDDSAEDFYISDRDPLFNIKRIQRLERKKFDRE